MMKTKSFVFLLSLVVGNVFFFVVHDLV